MAKILDFPSARIQGLSFLQNEVKHLLEQKGAGTDLQEFAAATVKDIYQRHVSAATTPFELRLPESIAAADASQLETQIATNLAALQAENHAVVVRLIAELTLTEVKLFQLQNG